MQCHVLRVMTKRIARVETEYTQNARPLVLLNENIPKKFDLDIKIVCSQKCQQKYQIFSIDFSQKNLLVCTQKYSA